MVALRSCQAHREAGNTLSGVYPLDLEDGRGPVKVYCWMKSDNSSWVVFQRRFDGSVDFYRGWNEYLSGFGNFSGEFWLGNDLLHRLTHAGFMEMRVELEDWDGAQAYATYFRFSVSDAYDFFRLRLDRNSFTGNAGNSLWDSNGERFSTLDADHDMNNVGSCSRDRHGAWWYWNCGLSNLNGRYYSREEAAAPRQDGIVWFYWKRWYYALRSTIMMVRQP